MNELLIHNVEEKLKKGIKSKATNDVATLLQDYVINALVDLCRQNSALAKAIIESDKTIYDCCKEITKDTKPQRHISDFDAYSRAVKFFDKEAEIEFVMRLKRKDNVDMLKLSLLDLME